MPLRRKATAWHSWHSWQGFCMQWPCCVESTLSLNSHHVPVQAPCQGSHVFPLLCVATCARCHFQVDAAMAMGQRFLKRFKFAGEWVKSLHQKCTCPDGLHKPLVRKGQNGSVSGDTKLLKESQSYPQLLGKWVLDNWLEQHKPAKPTVQLSTVPQFTAGNFQAHWKRPDSGASSSAPRKKQKLSTSSWKNPEVTAGPISMCSSWKRCR